MPSSTIEEVTILRKLDHVCWRFCCIFPYLGLFIIWLVFWKCMSMCQWWVLSGVGGWGGLSFQAANQSFRAMPKSNCICVCISRPDSLAIQCHSVQHLMNSYNFQSTGSLEPNLYTIWFMTRDISWLFCKPVRRAVFSKANQSVSVLYLRYLPMKIRVGQVYFLLELFLLRSEITQFLKFLLQFAWNLLNLALLPFLCFYSVSLPRKRHVLMLICFTLFSLALLKLERFTTPTMRCISY